MMTRQHLFCHFVSKGRSARQAALAAGYHKLCLEQNLQRLLICPRVQHQISLYGVEVDELRTNLKAQIKMCLQIMLKEQATDESRLEASRQMSKAQDKLEKLARPIQPRTNISPEQMDEWPEWRDTEPSPHDLVAQDKDNAEKATARAEKRAQAKLEKLKQSETMHAAQHRKEEQKQTLQTLAKIEQSQE